MKRFTVIKLRTNGITLFLTNKMCNKTLYLIGGISKSSTQSTTRQQKVAKIWFLLSKKSISEIAVRALMLNVLLLPVLLQCDYPFCYLMCPLKVYFQLTTKSTKLCSVLLKEDCNQSNFNHMKLNSIIADRVFVFSASNSYLLSF